MCPRKGSDNFEMAQFLGADIHQEVFASGIFAVDALDRILHGCRQFSVGPAELLQKHGAEPGIGCTDSNRVHKFLDMVIHLMLRAEG